jgi:hypothetical protein
MWVCLLVSLSPCFCLFIITDKVRVEGGGKAEGVGVIKNKERKGPWDPDGKRA